MSAHTEGPWTVVEHSWSRTGIYAKQISIAMLFIDDEATEEAQSALEDRMFANARLIAAAPELLAALKECIDWLDDGNRMLSDACASDVAKARAAIQKAEAA